MTTGSWNTVIQSSIGQTMAGNPTYVSRGTSVSWNGGDRAVKRRPKNLTKAERVAYYLERPGKSSSLSRPYATRKASPLPEGIKDVLGQDKNLFERVREKRFKLLETPDPGDYYTPHGYTKSWESKNFPEVEWGDGGTRLWFGVWRSTYTGSIITNGWSPGTLFLNTTGAWSGANDYKLLERLRKKVVGTDFNLASFLGAEGLDTLSFIGDVAHRVARSLHQAKRGNLYAATRTLTSYGRLSPKKAPSDLAHQREVYAQLIAAQDPKKSRAHVDALASQWLEYHLAAEPLLGDVKSAAEQLAHVTGTKRTQKVTAAVTQRTRYPLDAPSTPRWLGARTIRKAVVGHFTVAPEPVVFLGLQDPEVTIWNAIPLSFVADYFYDVGGWLEARATCAAFGSATYITSVKDEWVLEDCTGMNVPGGNHYRIPNALNTNKPFYRKGSLVRTVSSSLSDLATKPKFEPLGVFKSWQRMATAVSLVAVFSGRQSTPLGNLR